MTFGIETLLRVVGFMLLIAAAYFYYNGNRDGTFVAGVVGICAFFVAYRFRLKALITRQETESEPEPPANPDH